MNASAPRMNGHHRDGWIRSRRVLAVAVTLLLASGTAGCKHRVEIESDTCWDGIVNDGIAHVSGCGNATYDFSGGFRCLELQKQTDAGVLRARIGRRGAVWVETIAPKGIINVCN